MSGDKTSVLDFTLIVGSYTAECVLSMLKPQSCSVFVFQPLWLEACLQHVL